MHIKHVTVHSGGAERRFEALNTVAVVAHCDHIAYYFQGRRLPQARMESVARMFFLLSTLWVLNAR